MKCVITDYEYDDIDHEKRIIEGAGIELRDYQIKEGPALAEICADADAVVTQYSTVSREVIEQMKHCRMIIKYGIGVNNIDVQAAGEKGIFVCNVPDYGIEEVSDHAVAMLLALSRKLPVLSGAVRNGKWGFQSAYPLYRFCECTVGLMGFGRIPRLVAKKLSGFGCRILAYDPYVSGDEMKDYGVKCATTEEIYREADYISLHMPLTDQTRNMIGEEEIGLMKPNVCLINTSRGGLVNENALVKALSGGRMAGAALDVFEEEPIGADHPLLRFDSVIVTPHSAWYSEKAINVLQRKVAEEVVNVLGGNKPFHCVNIDKIKEGGL